MCVCSCVCAGSSYGKGKVYYGMGVENRIALVVFFRQLDEMAFNGIFMRCHSASATAPTGYGDGQRDRRRDRLIVELIDCQIDSFSRRDSRYELEL